jgi:hypothetical protein
MINLNKREILLPNNKIIKRKLYSKYVANNSPAWVKIKGIDFFVEYDEKHNIILDFCRKNEFMEKYPDYILEGEKTDNPILQKEDNILHVDKWYFDSMKKSVIKSDFWELVKN